MVIAKRVMMDWPCPAHGFPLDLVTRALVSLTRYPRFSVLRAQYGWHLNLGGMDHRGEALLCVLTHVC